MGEGVRREREAERKSDRERREGWVQARLVSLSLHMSHDDN
jgi:hypothetical protein